VNTNPLYTPRELEHQLKDSGATTMTVRKPSGTSANSKVVHKRRKFMVAACRRGKPYSITKRPAI